MTERLYWADSHLREFDARVLSCTEEKGRWAVVLDQTAFYPEGGGQSADTGTLNGVAVEDTRERGESVVHLCGAPLAVGSAVHGVLDWGLRFQRMQFHSAEHILSGLAHRKWGCNNVGFHMNPAFVTLDFDRELTADQLAELEAEANAIVWENRPVRIFFPSREERELLKKRRPDPEEPVLAITTREELVSAAYAVTGARALRQSVKLGTAIHLLGGILGLVIMAALAYLGSTELLTPTNILLYQLIWAVPGLLVTEWTRVV